jgi:glycosyltransferase involved in cell wall biosynthesis
MMLGVPGVASNVGGIPGIFEGGRDGILYEYSDTDALVTAVSEMFDDEAKAYGYAKNASVHALATHDPSANYSRLVEIYREIAG